MTLTFYVIILIGQEYGTMELDTLLQSPHGLNQAIDYNYDSHLGFTVVFWGHCLLWQQYLVPHSYGNEVNISRSQ